MPAMPNHEPRMRRRSSYEIVQEQLANLTEERVAANIARIRGTIDIYERIYGISSEEMRSKLAAGELEETEEICAWSQEITVLEHVLKNNR